MKAKARDLKLFLRFFSEEVGTDHPDNWTRPVTQAFLRHLEDEMSRKGTTVNRVLATLRHCAGWIHQRRAFLAGNPTKGIRELRIGEPEWRGLSSREIMRLRSASEQLAALKGQANQAASRDKAVFTVLLHTGLRVSELLYLDRRQYDGKGFRDIKRKGKVRTGQLPLPSEAREALHLYLEERDKRWPKKGPLICTSRGERMARQQVDRVCKQIAAQANSKLSAAEQIRLSAHDLRHTFLRALARKKGVEFAMEASGHTSSRHIWRYVRPSEEEKAEAVEGLF